MDNHYELIVVGAGPGGYVAAIKAAKLGIRTAVVEEREVGGTCLNRGCIPAKAMIHAATLYEEMKDAEQFGIMADNVRFDYEKIIDYKQGVITQLVGGVEQLFKGNGVDVIRGRGVLHANKEVHVTAPDGAVTIYTADNIILAAGSKPVVLNIPGMKLPGVISSDELFKLRERPDSIAIIGGGVIGVEFANAFSYFGTKVTIIEGMDRILPNMDREISQNLKMIMKKRGVDIYTNAMVKGLEEDGELTAVHFVQKDEEKSVSAQYVLCSVGRGPNTKGLFAEDAMPDMERGRILVDEHFQSSIPGVYAIGDCVIGMQLAHTASAQGIVTVEHLAGKEGSIDLDVVPACVYTNPEIASVGITEDEAKTTGLDVIVGKYIMGGNGKSLITREDRGFIKVVARADDHRLVGAQMMCARATDMISEMAVAIANNMTAEQMVKAIRPHPTYNEGVGEAVEELLGEAIHVMPKKKKRK
ncbi:MAG: dihydrolipoyl dehydrogenase [Peptococcaceae bacterium]|nr:dihydrolipoyl dehydrogenase [Peptococcaceae bacterium]